MAERVTLLHRDLSDRRPSLTAPGPSSSARTDPLTQLGNRRQLEDDLSHLQGQLRRYGHRYAAAVLALDHFESFATTYGPMAGDEALRLLANTVVQQLRTGDRAYRLSRAPCSSCSPSSGQTGRVAVDRIRAAMAAQAVPHPGNPPTEVLTASGYRQFTTPALGDAQRYDDLVSRAESALARAQQAGSNRVEVDEGGAASGATS